MVRTVCLLALTVVTPTIGWSQRPQSEILELGAFAATSTFTEIDAGTDLTAYGVTVALPLTDHVSGFAQGARYHVKSCNAFFPCTDRRGTAILGGVEYDAFGRKRSVVRPYLGAGAGYASNKVIYSVFAGAGVELLEVVVPRVEMRWETWPATEGGLTVAAGLHFRISR